MILPNFGITPFLVEEPKPPKISRFRKIRYRKPGMASVPQSMMIAKSRRKKLEKEMMMNGGCNLPSCYNNKMMDSIWGQYNKYSVHNLKSEECEHVSYSGVPEIRVRSASPMSQIMQEYENQLERTVSPVIQHLMTLDNYTERSRSPLGRILLDHRREKERSRSPSVSEDEWETERSRSPVVQLVHQHDQLLNRSSSPLTTLAKEHRDKKERVRSSLQRQTKGQNGQMEQERCSSPFQLLFQEPTTPGFLHN